MTALAVVEPLDVVEDVRPGFGTGLVAVAESTAPAMLVTRAHRALLRSAAGFAATVPLAANGEPVGAMTFQSYRARSLTAEELATIENLTAMVAPALFEPGRWDVADRFGQSHTAE